MLPLTPFKLDHLFAFVNSFLPLAEVEFQLVTFIRNMIETLLQHLFFLLKLNNGCLKLIDFFNRNRYWIR